MKRHIERITRWYYQVLDFTQQAWVRFRKSEAGEAFVWLVPRFFKLMWWTLLGSLAFIMLCYAGMLFLFLVCTGNGKAAINSFTKIMLVVVGLFAAKQLISHKADVANAVKAVTKGD
jgi:hypothetical protein